MRIGAVVLAAGQGSRMGNQAKAMLQLQGIPLVKRHLAALRSAGINEIVVVTGYHYEQIEPVVQGLAAQVVRNPNPSVGQASSVRLGVAAIGDRFDAVIMMLCDQPLIDEHDIEELVASFVNRSQGEILVPLVNKTRGNPAVFSGKAIREILAQGPDMYCRKYMDQNPDLVVFFETNNEHFITDVDTLDDLANFEKKWGYRLALPETPNATG